MKEVQDSRTSDCSLMVKNGISIGRTFSQSFLVTSNEDQVIENCMNQYSIDGNS